MVSIAFGFLLGVVILQQSVSLPSGIWGFALVLCLPAIFLCWSYRFFWAVCIGFLYALIPSDQRLENRIMPQLEGHDLIINGYVQSIPDKRGNDWRFQLQINKAYKVNETGGKSENLVPLTGKIKLTWYHVKSTVQLHAGEEWQLRVRLKQPSGFMNPHGFDYEKWLFQRGIVATGYVRTSSKNKKLTDAPFYSVNALREKVLTRIQQVLADSQVVGVISALSVAERRDISDEQWLLFRQTGTNHLMAISGLHIGIVAGFGFLPIAIVWWLFPRLSLRVPLRVAGGIMGALFAISYAVLAGFTVPTQRALIMVLVLLYALLTRRHYSALTVFSFALIAVLFIDPFAVLSSGFWLSFLAVGLIIGFVQRRLTQQRFAVLGVQLALSICMLPLTLAFFGSGSLSSPMANLLAIPWVSFVVVPLILLSLMMLFVFQPVGEWLLHLAAGSVELLLAGLGYFAAPQWMLHMPAVPDVLLLIAFIGLLWLWLPAGFPARWLGALLLLPAWFYQPKAIENNSFQYHLLDVGQGLASVVQTRHHTLIYDTGFRMGDFDTGKLVMMPFLRGQGIKHIDMLMISHSDIDHRGGAKHIVENIPIHKIMSSDTTILPNHSVTACVQGLRWVWDGVLFEILHPTATGIKGMIKNRLRSDNNQSCVLRISNGQHRLLLTGDIQKRAENRLVQQFATKNTDHLYHPLQADVMLMPHHGSNTSSKQAFIDAVQPQLVLVATGYRNRFGFPKKRVIQRYQANGITTLNTAKQGAISVYFPANKQDYEVISYRQQQRYWHRR